MEIPKALANIMYRLRFFISASCINTPIINAKRLKTIDILNSATIQAMYTIDIALTYINFLLSFFSLS